MTFVYLDVETTGLDPDRHEVWEIAWAREGGIRSAFVPHSIVTAEPKALEIGDYWHRFDPSQVDLEADFDARLALDGATLVGANPAFDAAFLRARWGVTPWRHRLLDVEAYAMGALGFDEPRGLAAIREALVGLGHGIPEPDHTAAGDVATVRACHLALRSIYAERGPVMTTPDRLAAAVAQGHEDAVQVGPQEDARCEVCGEVHAWDDDLTPAPASSPAGEDVERVARALAEHVERLPAHSNAIGCACGWEGVSSGIYRPWPDFRVHQAEAALAALSARPVEAQEVERLRAEVERHALANGGCVPGDAYRDLAEHVGDIRDERDAALARATSWEAEADRLAQVAGDEHRRAEAAEAEVERLRRWKAEALPVMAGLQDLGQALGMGLGERITGEAAAEKARALTADLAAARAALAEIRAMNVPEFLRSHAAISTRPGQYDAMNALAKALDAALAPSVPTEGGRDRG